MVILADAQRRRFFLVPDIRALSKGELVLEALSGESFAVSEEEAAAYEVPEAVAKAVAEEQHDGLSDLLSTAKVALEQASEDTRQLSAAMGIGDNEEVLRRLGIDPEQPDDRVLDDLLALLRRLGIQVPEAIGDIPETSRALDWLDRVVDPKSDPARPGQEGGRGRPTRDVLRAIGEHDDADAELRDAARDLEALLDDLDH